MLKYDIYIYILIYIYNVQCQPVLISTKINTDSSLRCCPLGRSKKDWLVEFDGDISIDMAGLRPMLDEQPTERWEDSWEDGNAGSKKLW